MGKAEGDNMYRYPGCFRVNHGKSNIISLIKYNMIYCSFLEYDSVLWFPTTAEMPLSGFRSCRQDKVIGQQKVTGTLDYIGTFFSKVSDVPSDERQELENLKQSIVERKAILKEEGLSY